MDGTYKVWNKSDKVFEFEGFYLDQVDASLNVLGERNRLESMSDVVPLLFTGAYTTKKEKVYDRDILQSEIHGTGVVVYHKESFSWRVEGEGYVMPLVVYLKSRTSMVGNFLSDPAKAPKHGRRT